MREVHQEAEETLWNSRRGAAALRTLTNNYGISEETIKRLRIGYLDSSVQIELKEGKPEVIRIWRGLLVPVASPHDGSTAGYMTVSDKGRVRLVRGSRSFAHELNVRENRPLVVTGNPIFAAALAEQLGEKAGVMAIAIGRGPSPLEIRRLQYVPCVLLDRDAEHLQPEMQNWRNLSGMLSEFDGPASRDVGSVAADIKRSARAMVNEVRCAPVGKVAKPRLELLLRIKRLGGAVVWERGRYVGDDLRYGPSPGHVTEIQYSNAVAFAGLNAGRYRYVAMADRDGVCRVADLTWTSGERVDHQFTPYEMPDEIGKVPSIPRDLFSLEGAASYIAGRFVGLEEAMREYLGNVLDERDLYLALHHDEDLAELAAFRALVRNLLLVRLERELVEEGKRDNFNRMFEEGGKVPRFLTMLNVNK
jgi:hypothetical protein